jgi:hypothetical protein
MPFQKALSLGLSASEHYVRRSALPTLFIDPFCDRLLDTVSASRHGMSAMGRSERSTCGQFAACLAVEKLSGHPSQALIGRYDCEDERISFTHRVNVHALLGVILLPLRRAE